MAAEAAASRRGLAQDPRLAHHGEDRERDREEAHEGVIGGAQAGEEEGETNARGRAVAVPASGGRERRRPGASR